MCTSLHSTTLQARNKHNTVSRYEIDDSDDNELADSKFYYQFGSGDFKINAVKGDQSGENLLKADSSGIWGSNLPPTWTVQLKAPMEKSSLAGDAPGLLLWLAEEERGIWGLSWGVGAVITFILITGFCALYMLLVVARGRGGD